MSAFKLAWDQMEKKRFLHHCAWMSDTVREKQSTPLSLQGNLSVIYIVNVGFIFSDSNMELHALPLSLSDTHPRTHTLSLCHIYVVKACPHVLYSFKDWQIELHAHAIVLLQLNLTALEGQGFLSIKRLLTRWTSLSGKTLWNYLD